MIASLLLSLALQTPAPATPAPSFTVEVAQSGARARPVPSWRPGDAPTVVRVKRRPFTLRFQLKHTDNVRVFATTNPADLERDDLFCGGCGMADYDGNRDWGVQVNAPSDDPEMPLGYNYWFVQDARNHRCDPEPTPGKGRCWRTIWRVGETRLEELPAKEVFLLMVVGTTDPETYATKIVQRRLVKLVLQGPPAKKASVDVARPQPHQ